MNLVSQYRKDVEEFAEQYGRPIDQRYWAELLVSKTLEVVENLFHGAEIEKASDGSILVALDDGSLLALICLPARELGAFATHVGTTYFVAINFGLIRFLFNLSLSVWKDQRFLSHIKSDVRDLTVLGNDLIPPGFEDCFLDNTFGLSDHIKHTVFYRCFEKAISFFWLHEIAHVFGGHIDICARSEKALGIIDEFFNVAEPDDDKTDESIRNEIPYHAFEIEADHWALNRIFRQLHQQMMADSAGGIELIYTAVACTLFPLSLHGYKFLQYKSDLAEKHPPLWFRADYVIKAEDKAANEQWFYMKRGEKKFEMIRFKQQNLVQLGLTGLSQLHPMFGDWISPVAELSRQAEFQRVLAEAEVTFSPWRDELSRYCHSTKMKTN